jgi:pimeloyl-ACP methyl ester carboxylesterase
MNLQNFGIGMNPLSEYLVDTAQRTVLYWDVMRQRGNQYLEHMNQEAPHVLHFDGELIMDARTLETPVNYALVKIHPPQGVTTDPLKRPTIVIDPRAGHGPGIGGFKADSEIGVALQGGHPCYFVGFLPNPEPGQTIEAVMEAEIQFVEKVIELHPDAEGKPMIIGNCQAGWATMMLAAARPDLCGPIIIAGAPISYWAGVRGANPMRYTGGLLGGSWLTALMGDIGNGTFDGAWLVQNFENLNPANTLVSKQYGLYADVDTEGPRYLGFERWWGGHVSTNAEEMQYIVDNLFVGNKLATADLVTSKGLRLDFRNIKSPIVCFCSKGDNITPPQQALGWILDLYDSVDDIQAAEQTIVYTVHESIGHLGIFVSGGVAKKEHQEFSENIDLIDCLPPGLYEAVIEAKSADDANLELVSNEYISRFEVRTLDDIRALGCNSEDDERAFATVARLSEITHGLYRTTLQPLVRGLATPQSAEWLRETQPLRLGYKVCSDQDPLMKWVESGAEQVRSERRPASENNPFRQWETFWADTAARNLDAFRDWRDALQEQSFFAIYGNPWVQALFGLKASDGSPRPHPGVEQAHLDYVTERMQELRGGMSKGGPTEAAIRALIYIRMPAQAVDERGFEMMRRTRLEHGKDMTLEAFKQTIRDQYFTLLLDEHQALEAIPTLLKGQEQLAPELLERIHGLATATGALDEEGRRRFEAIKVLFDPSVTRLPAKRPRKAG